MPEYGSFGYALKYSNNIMEESKGQLTGTKIIDRDHTKDLKKLHNEHKELSKRRIQKAKECIECLKFSEGLVRRDIDLIRMQLEIKLKKLESRLQAELRKMVETETAKLEKFITEVNLLEENESAEDKIKAIDELQRTAHKIERKRLKFIANKTLEKSLDDITSFGNIVLQRVNDCDTTNKVSDKRIVVKRPEPSNGLRPLSLDFRLPLETQQTTAVGHDVGSVQTQKRQHRISSVSRDRDCEYDHLECTKMQNDAKNCDGRQTELADNSSANTRSADLKFKNGEIRCSLSRTGSLHPEDRNVTNSDNMNLEQRSEPTRNAPPQNPINHAIELNEGIVDTKSEDWMKADPFSVLRALKLQTSRTEENLKAIRELRHDTGDKSEEKVFVKGDVKDPRKLTVSGNEPNDGNKDLRNHPTSGHSEKNERKNSTDSYLKKNRDSYNRNDPMYVKHDDEIHVDKVARANELWFGRERKRRNEIYKRRTRSLSPKTVRFYVEDTHDDLPDKHDEVFLNNGNETLSNYRVVKTLCRDSDIPADNNITLYRDFQGLPNSMIPGTKEHNKNAISNDSEHLYGSDKDDSKAGTFTSLLLRNGIDKETLDRNPFAEPGKNSYEKLNTRFPQIAMVSRRKLDETKNDKHSATLYEHVQDSDLVKTGIKRATNTFANTDHCHDFTSSFRPTHVQHATLDHEKRQHKLRDRRRRHRTICGLTTEGIKLNKPSSCSNDHKNSTDPINSTERDYRSDLPTNEGSTTIEISSNILSDISLTPSVYYIPRRRLHSEGSPCIENTEETTGKETEHENKLNAPFHCNNNSKSYKVKTERQRIPSFKEMLFLG